MTYKCAIDDLKNLEPDKQVYLQFGILLLVKNSLLSKGKIKNVLPCFEIFVNKGLVYKIRVLMWQLNNQCNLYLQFNSTFKNSFPTDFIHLINSYNICQGIKNRVLQPSTNEAIQQTEVQLQKFSFLKEPLLILLSLGIIDLYCCKM